MTDAQLDTVYTALAEALGRVGEAKTPLFLSTLSLALLAKQAEAQVALDVLVQAESLI